MAARVKPGAGTVGAAGPASGLPNFVTKALRAS